MDPIPEQVLNTVMNCVDPIANMGIYTKIGTGNNGMGFKWIKWGWDGIIS